MYDPVWKHPSTSSEAVSILTDSGSSARVIAGGTDLSVLIRNGSVRPDVLIDLGRVDELRFVRERDGETQIGALATHGEVAADARILTRAPVLAAACRSVGSPQIRARGTLAGNLANASPAADSAVALLALGASAVVEPPNGTGATGSIPLESLFLGPGETAIRPNQLLRSLRFATPSERSRSAYCKIGQRKALAIAIVSLAAVFEPEAGTVSIALGSVAPTAVRATEAEALFASEWSAGGDRDRLLAAVAKKARDAANCIDDVRASGHYRMLLVEALTRRVLSEICH